MKRKRVFSILQAAGIAVLLLFALPVDAKTEKPDSVASVSNTPEEEEEDIPIPAEAIDLGLPSGTLWASYNIGATKPEEYGHYFAWGETKPKGEYTWDNYMCPESTCGKSGDPVFDFVGDKADIAGTKFDAATMNWGASWKMPTAKQIEELASNCSSSLVTINGVQCRKLKSRINGNEIIFPLSGARWFESFAYEGTLGYYWSSTLRQGGYVSPGRFIVRNDTHGYGWSMGGENDRFCGFPIRPVKTPSATSLKIEPTEIDIYLNAYGQVQVESGSGSYEIINKNPDIVETSFISDGLPNAKALTPGQDSGKIDDLLSIKGIALGDAIVQVKDKNTGEVADVKVHVGAAPHLSLSAYSQTLTVGQSVEVKILTGSGMYESTTDNREVVNVRNYTQTISSPGELINGIGNPVSRGGATSQTYYIVEITAKSEGRAIVSVKDLSSSEVAEIAVNVKNNSSGNEGWRKTIIVTTLDGTTMEYLIDEDTKIKVEKPYLVIETDNVVLNYELEKMKHVRYGKKLVSDGIEDVTVQKEHPFTMKDETLFFKGLPENSQVSIYTLDGKAVVSRQCSGDASLSLNSLPSGMYIVKINNESYKILKK